MKYYLSAARNGAFGVASCIMIGIAGLVVYINVSTICELHDTSQYEVVHVKADSSDRNRFTTAKLVSQEDIWLKSTQWLRL